LSGELHFNLSLYTYMLCFGQKPYRPAYISCVKRGEFCLFDGEIGNGMCIFHWMSKPALAN